MMEQDVKAQHTAGEALPILRRLREESLALQKSAWARPDGGQECSLSACLADEADDIIFGMYSAMMGVLDIVGRAESNASGTPEWDYVGPRVAAFRAAIAKATGEQP